MYTAEKNYTPTLADLTEEVAELSSRYALAGSIGRCIVMGNLDLSLQRKNEPRDLDVIRLTPELTTDPINIGPFRVDADLEKYIRPISQTSWGLFLPKKGIATTEPLYELDAELFEAKIVPIPWDKERTAKVLPGNIQAQLLTISGPYRKNREHKNNFMRWASEHAQPLPREVTRTFEEYTTIQRESVSRLERSYRTCKHLLHTYAPAQFNTLEQSRFGTYVRKVRGTGQA